MTAHLLACALYCNSGGTLNGLGTVVAWLLGVPLGLALAAGALRVIFGGGGRRR
jgi:hypothetical protein